MNKISHIAFIMDGNGRWGKKNNLSISNAYHGGAKNVEIVIDHLIRKNIPTASFFAFSAENWKRSKKEIRVIFSILKYILKEKIYDLHNKGVKISIMGDLSGFSSDIALLINDAILLTKENKKIHVVIALSYGGRQEIINAANKILKSKSTDEVTMETFRQNLYLPDLSDIDVLIRTGGDRRISNFCLWQLAYTEIYFIDKYWPELGQEDVDYVIKEFLSTKRNFGKSRNG